MKIFVGGSARKEISDNYKEEAVKLGKKLLNTNHEIYCCASTVGIIGGVYNLIKEQDASRIKSAVPKAHLGYNDKFKEDITVITDTINQRTDYILQNCDYCIFLPGGIGTIYEIMSSIETKRANEHKCELVIVNLFGYFDELLAMLEKAYNQEFASREDEKVYKIINSIEELNI